MRFRGSYPLITTPHLFEARDFYVRHFGFEPLFQATWFVYLASPEGPALAFMHPDHPSSPPGPEPFSGLGMIFTLEVEDAEAAHGSLVASGAPLVHPLTDEDWGQRRFMTRDPSGMLVDVVEQTEPTPEFWERYGLAEETPDA